MAELAIEAERVEDLAAEGRRIVAVGFAEWGRPTVLLTDEEHAEVPFGRSADGSFANRTAARPYPATLVRPDGEHIDLGAIETTFPQVQALPGDRAVVVGTRCRPGEHNAVVIGPTGAREATSCLGDGIAHVQTATDGAIWAGYFDEGVYGGAGDGPETIGAHGLVRFGADGEATYRYEPPSGIGPIDDCYALCVGDDAVWACYYSGFPLVRVRPDGTTRAWRDGVGGASALAVDRSRVLFHGGYGERRHEAHLGRLGGVAVEGRRPVRIVDDRGRRLAPDRVEGRGRHLHLLCGTTWWRVDLATVPA